MDRGQHGFTLIELMIVIAIIAVIASIAIPNLLASRLSANETAAISTLRMLVTCQAQFQQRGLADEDVDGLGEYGTFAEMSGAVSVRGGGTTIRPPILSTAFRTINGNGEMVRLVRPALYEAGMPKDRVSIETYFNHHADPTRDAIKALAERCRTGV